MVFKEAVCDDCGKKEFIPAGNWYVHCTNPDCQQSLILAPVKKGKRYIRCDKREYMRINVGDKIYKCDCGEEHAVGETTEIRNGQVIHCGGHIKQAYLQIYDLWVAAKEELKAIGRQNAERALEKEKELARTKKEKKEQQKVLSQLQDQCDALRKEKDDLEAAVLVAGRLFDANVEATKQQWEDRFKAAEEALQTVEEKATLLENGLEVKKDKIEEMEKVAAALEQKARVWEREVEGLKREKELWETKVEVLKLEKEEAVKGGKAKLQRLQKANEEEMELLKTEGEAVLKREVALKELLKRLEGNLKEAEAMLQEELLKEKREMELAKEDDKLQKTIELLKEEKEHLEVALKEEAGNLQKAVAEGEATKEVCAKLQKEMDLLRQKDLLKAVDLVRQKELLKEAEDELQDVKLLQEDLKLKEKEAKQLEALKMDVARLERQVGKGEAEAEKVKLLKVEVARLEKDLKEGEAKYEEKTAEAEAMKTALALLTQEKADLRASLGDWEDFNEKREEEMEQLKEALDQLHRTAEERQEQTQDMANCIVGQRAEIDSLKEQNKRLIESVHAALVVKSSGAVASEAFASEVKPSKAKSVGVKRSSPPPSPDYEKGYRPILPSKRTLRQWRGAEMGEKRIRTDSTTQEIPVTMEAKNEVKMSPVATKNSVKKKGLPLVKKEEPPKTEAKSERGHPTVTVRRNAPRSAKTLRSYR